MGTEITPTTLGMVGLLVQSSKNLSEVFRVYAQYGYMVCAMIDLTYTEAGRTATVEFHQNSFWKSKYPESARQGMDSSLSGTLNILRVLTGKNIYPIGVETEYPRKNSSEYTRLLQTTVVFSAPASRIIFHLDDMACPLVSSDKSVFELFNNILGQKKALFLQSSCSRALKQLLLMQFKGQIPTIEEAAVYLKMSPRTLQRKLLEEKTSYRQLANEVKKEIALQLLRHSPHNITQVAGILGYSDLPAFRRAFKSWTQETPKSLKRRTSEERELI